MTPCKERPLLCFQIPPEVLFDLQQIAINPAAAARARRSPALPRCRAKRADAGSGQNLTIFSKLDVFCRKGRDVADHIIGQNLGLNFKAFLETGFWGKPGGPMDGVVGHAAAQKASSRPPLPGAAQQFHGLGV